ncbi:aspartate/glutamate racemase family protein [Aquincola sp. MAHUQ-54]|uniref:Aspartate/glutamate racemase family protein n=1 Tax=Aquincola agrisoli TaxID=3119538 RepID=A0AAW9QKH3_9BURK
MKKTPRILLINPNTSAATTGMMVRIAAAAAGSGAAIEGVTARRGAPMIVDEAEMAVASAEVLAAWHAADDGGWDGVIVSAFGDPGLDAVRAAARVPVVGICEASILDGAQGGRRFGIATVTPALAELLRQRVAALGAGAHYSGIRLTAGEPRALAAEPARLEAELAQAVRRCIDDDGAEAVVIGGGPLGQAAEALQARCQVPLIAPIPSAVARLLARIDG